MPKRKIGQIGQIGPIGPIGQIDPIKTTGNPSNASIKKLGYYMTHDNGGRPYKVVITRRRNRFVVKVYRFVAMDESKPTSHKDYFVFEKQPAFNILAWRVFVASRKSLPIGEQHDFRPSDWCDYENASGDKHMYYDGHVVVCQVAHNRFVYICERVYRFCTLSKVTAFYSFIRGTDGVYACFVDEEHNVYSLSDQKYVNLAADILAKTDNVHEYCFIDRFNQPMHDMPIDVLDIGLARLGH